MEQKNWAVVRQVAGYHRYDTDAERLLLNRICVLHQRASRHAKVTKKAKNSLDRTYATINPAAVQREIQALTAELLALDTVEAAARRGHSLPALPTRASESEATKTPTCPS